MTVEIFMVGGAVRDEIMGVESHDIDFSVVTGSFEEMKEFILDAGLKIVQSKPEFGTIRAVAPKAGFRGHGGGLDFVWAREDGPSSDGRRPDWVKPGTLFQDLARRDFTMNAIARDEAGNLIDPFGGQADIAKFKIRAVGIADDRIQEDGLRILRALRFSVTKDFFLDRGLVGAINANVDLLRKVSKERVREEMEKMFMHDTGMAFEVMNEFPGVKNIVFGIMQIRLKPTLEQ